MPNGWLLDDCFADPFGFSVWAMQKAWPLPPGRYWAEPLAFPTGKSLGKPTQYARLIRLKKTVQIWQRMNNTTSSIATCKYNTNKTWLWPSEHAECAAHPHIVSPDGRLELPNHRFQINAEIVIL
jgi:hypothetical protein